MFGAIFLLITSDGIGGFMIENMTLIDDEKSNVAIRRFCEADAKWYGRLEKFKHKESVDNEN